jgi:hypothetical protein
MRSFLRSAGKRVEAEPDFTGASVLNVQPEHSGATDMHTNAVSFYDGALFLQSQLTCCGRCSWWCFELRVGFVVVDFYITCVILNRLYIGFTKFL